MSVFDAPGTYARSPQGGVENIQDLLDAGFRWYAFNVGDHTVAEWATVIARCRSLGMAVLPWDYVRSDAEVKALCDLAKREFDGMVIVNAEKPLDAAQPGGAKVTLECIANECEGMDAALSVEPWPFASVDWTQVAKIPIQIQLFPQENETSRDPRACRAAYYDAGVERAEFMLGMHELNPYAFPPRQYAYSVYTVDDMGSDYFPWGPQSFPPLSASHFPKVAPGYGPSSPSGKPQSKKSLAWRALKRALHHAGFGSFPDPDSAYNSKLAAAMRNLQRVVGLTPSGDYGSASYEAMRSLQKTRPLGGYAMDSQACEWTRLAKLAGDPK
jgi:hypothetical protein